MLILVDDPDRMGQPVGYIGREPQLASEYHITVGESGGVQDLSNVVDAWLDYHAAVLAAFLEGLLDVRGFVNSRGAAIVFIRVDVAVTAKFDQQPARETW